MYGRMILNDFLNNRVTSLMTVIFIAASAMLITLTVILIVNLSGAVDNLMAAAETPHFMQMHSGAMDKERLVAFAESEKDVEYFQVAEFLNIEADRIIINGRSLSGSIQDNGFCIQNNEFDYLLGLDDSILYPAEGEAYLPVSLLKEGTAAIGDLLEVGDIDFTVAGFLRDSQMNSTLASSKRFLISHKDYKSLRSLGSVEYLIEFRLKDLSALGRFQGSYTTAGLESSGPVINWSLFRFLNAVSDGLMIGVLFLISLLITGVALLCLRFSLLAKIEDEYREIGVMKVLGMRLSEIKRIYLGKYGILTASGCVAGLVLSLLVKDIFLENIRLYMGGENSGMDIGFALLSTFLIFLVITTFVNRVLRRFKNVYAVDALRFCASVAASTDHSEKLTLGGNRILPTNIFMGLKDILAGRRLYITMLLVFITASFIMIVPSNLYTTISSRDFSAYMGIGTCDIRMDLQQTEDIPKKAENIMRQLSGDPSVKKAVVLTTKSIPLGHNEGGPGNIKVELGDHSLFPVKYTQGRFSVNSDEIALSTILAEELDKKIGDKLVAEINGRNTPLAVCGIYSDITNGGMTAKAAFSDDSARTMWSVICIDLSDRRLTKLRVEELKREFNFAKVSGLDDYVKKTFGSAVDSIQKASFASVVAALIIASGVTLMFVTMLIARDRYSIAVMRATGFTINDIRIQYITRSVFVLIIGAIAGVLLANTAGEGLAGFIISSLGVSSFGFTLNPGSYTLFPLLLLLVVCAATVTGSSAIRRIRILDYIKE